MKKKGILIAILMAVLLVFNSFTGYFSKLYISTATGVGDSDDIEVMFNFGKRYGITAHQVAEVYNSLPFIINSEMFDMGDKKKSVEIIALAADGKTEDEIRQWVKDRLFASGFEEQKLKSLANMGWHPIEVYVMSEESIQRIFDSVRQANEPGGTMRMLVYENLAEVIFDKYKNGMVEYNQSFAQPPQDFIFPETIRWDKYGFYQDEMGYFAVLIPSADEKYTMAMSVDDTVYQNIDGTVTDNAPFVRHVNFYKN